ncbi:Maf family protein [Candidatus Saccharibacteria bacterium]|nr:Maf family protein [Candidatus Saccharibacteria bacterium]
MTKIILASGSFLKKFIMDASKLSYEVVAADIDESIYDNLAVSERVVELAEDKCNKVAAMYPDSVVIAADTLTADESGLVYTKLTGEDDPIKAAVALSGQTINVLTGCAVYTPETGVKSILATATIAYQTFTEANLRRLASDDNPNIRSGALGIFYDAPGFTLIERIEGSYTGAFGLPMEFVYAQLGNTVGEK